jgi:hypothetical protein
MGTRICRIAAWVREPFLRVTRQMRAGGEERLRRGIRPFRPSSLEVECLKPELCEKSDDPAATFDGHRRIRRLSRPKMLAD